MARRKKNKKEIPEDSAVARVFGIVELTEKILLEVPFKNLLRWLRVSKHINTVVKGSLALQRKLYLAPEPANSENEKRLLPLLPKLFSTFYRSYSSRTRRIELDLSSSCSQMLVAQPPILFIRCVVIFGKCHMHTFRPDPFSFELAKKVNGITLGDISNDAKRQVADRVATISRKCFGCIQYKIVLYGFHGMDSIALPVEKRQEELRKKRNCKAGHLCVLDADLSNVSQHVAGKFAYQSGGLSRQARMRWQRHTLLKQSSAEPT